MILGEQELINAICAHTAERRGIQPSEVEVQLEYEEATGFAAELSTGGRNWYITEAGMLEAVQWYLIVERDMRIYTEQLELDVEDEMIVRIQED